MAASSEERSLLWDVELPRPSEVVATPAHLLHPELASANSSAFSAAPHPTAPATSAAADGDALEKLIAENRQLRFDLNDEKSFVKPLQEKVSLLSNQIADEQRKCEQLAKENRHLVEITKAHEGAAIKSTRGLREELEVTQHEFAESKKSLAEVTRKLEAVEQMNQSLLARATAAEKERDVAGAKLERMNKVRTKSDWEVTLEDKERENAKLRKENVILRRENDKHRQHKQDLAEVQNAVAAEAEQRFLQERMAIDEDFRRAQQESLQEASALKSRLSVVQRDAQGKMFEADELRIQVDDLKRQNEELFKAKAHVVAEHERLKTHLESIVKESEDAVVQCKQDNAAALAEQERKAFEELTRRDGAAAELRKDNESLRERLREMEWNERQKKEAAATAKQPTPAATGFKSKPASQGPPARTHKDPATSPAPKLPRVATEAVRSAATRTNSVTSRGGSNARSQSRPGTGNSQRPGTGSLKSARGVPTVATHAVTPGKRPVSPTPRTVSPTPRKPLVSPRGKTAATSTLASVTPNVAKRDVGCKSPMAHAKAPTMATALDMSEVVADAHHPAEKPHVRAFCCSSGIRAEVVQLLAAIDPSATFVDSSTHEQIRKATHVVLADSSAAATSLRTLYGFGMGLWVVNVSYLQACAKNGGWLPEADFDGKRWTTPPVEGKRVYATAKVLETNATKDVLKHCGAVFATSPESTDAEMIICTENESSDFGSTRRKMVRGEFLHWLSHPPSV